MTVHGEVNQPGKSRTRVLMTGTLIAADGAHNVLVRDVSRHGAQIYTNSQVSQGKDVCLRRGPIFVAARVAWCRNNVAGIEFYRTLTTSEIDQAFHPVFECDPEG